MKKIIAYSLFGERPMYWKGAELNIQLAKQYYPGWICRFYVDKNSRQELIDLLKGDNVEVVLTENKGGYHGTFWRFYPTDDSDVSILLSRDADSRLGEREAHAVNEWLSSDKQFHLMRDHVQHMVPILAGMWGVKNPLLKGIKNIIETSNIDFNSKFADQIFLGNFIYPKIAPFAMEHCDHSISFGNPLHKFVIPLPAKEEYVGRCYGDEDWEPFNFG